MAGVEAEHVAKGARGARGPHPLGAEGPRLAHSSRRLVAAGVGDQARQGVRTGWSSRGGRRTLWAVVRSAGGAGCLGGGNGPRPTVEPRGTRARARPVHQPWHRAVATSRARPRYSRGTVPSRLAHAGVGIQAEGDGDGVRATWRGHSHSAPRWTVRRGDTAAVGEKRQQTSARRASETCWTLVARHLGRGPAVGSPGARLPHASTTELPWGTHGCVGAQRCVRPSPVRRRVPPAEHSHR